MKDLFEHHPVPLSEQLADAERELHMRLVVYPRRVSAGTMSEAQAARQIRAQRAIIASLRSLAGIQVSADPIPC